MATPHAGFQAFSCSGGPEIQKTVLGLVRRVALSG
jgi:hypothetical protein